MKRGPGLFLWSFLLVLLASLSFNVALLSRRGPWGAGAARAAGNEAPPRRPGREAACQARLRQCQRDSLDTLIGTFHSRDRRWPPVARGAAPPNAAAPGEGAAAIVTPVDAALQDSVLCDIAKKHLHRRWTGDRERIIASVRRDLGDLAGQRRKTARDLGKLSGLLGLSDEQRRRVRQAYEPLRAGKMKAIRAALSQDSIDGQKVLKQVKELYAGEDRIINQLFGPRAREQLRAAQLEKRTAILALAATLAGLSWDHALGW